MEFPDYLSLTLSLFLSLFIPVYRSSFIAGSLNCIQSSHKTDVYKPLLDGQRWDIYD